MSEQDFYREEYERLYGNEPTIRNYGDESKIGNNTFELVNDLEQFITDKYNTIHKKQ
jgi:hypothetical protein